MENGLSPLQDFLHSPTSFLGMIRKIHWRRGGQTGRRIFVKVEVEGPQSVCWKLTGIYCVAWPSGRTGWEGALA